MALRNRRLAELTIFLALTLLHTWPLASDPAHLSRLDNNDTAFNTWVIAWVQHQLPHDPVHLFEAPIFYPEHDTLAYSEHMIVPAAMGLPLNWAGASPVLVYNLLAVAGFLLSGLSMSWVVRRWTGCFAAGVIAGALFAFNAHVLTRFAHLQALHVEFFPIALYALDRFLSEPHPRWAALFGAAFVLQSLCSNYAMVMLALAVVIAAAVRPELWRFERRLWSLAALVTASVAVILTPVLLPYYHLHQTQGLTRTIEDVRLYSASWQDYLATAGRLHYTLWSHRFAADRTALFPGVTALLLSGVALGTGSAWRDRRARSALAFGIAGVCLSFGANLPGYEWLQEHVTILQGMRAAARWGYLALVSVAILAGFGTAAVANRVRGRSWWPALVVAMVGAVTIEAMRTPLALVRFNGIASVHSRLRSDDVHAVVMYPFYSGEAFHMNAPYLLDQTRHWKPMVNGYSSFAPESFFERAQRLKRFPDSAVIAELRSIGVTHVMIARRPFEELYGRETLARLRRDSELQFLIDQEGWLVYRIR